MEFIPDEKILTKKAKVSEMRPLDLLLRSDHKQTPLSGPKKQWIIVRQRIFNMLEIFKIYRSPLAVLKLLKEVRTIRKNFSGSNKITKLIEVDGKYYWRLNIPGWGTPHFNPFLRSELGRIKQHDGSVKRLTNAYVAITKKCPLKCEHCFEWNNLNKPEVLGDQQLDKIIENLQQIGTSIISLTGGEPTLRVRDMERIIQKYGKNSAFWVLTSGFNFTEENAKRLKEAGLTGVVISLDHYQAEKHDQFRGFPGAFENVVKAVKYSLDNRLVTALSVCLSKETANEEFLLKYMELAKDLGVAFVQLLEPKPVGHYAGKDVNLTMEDFEVTDRFYTRMNEEADFADFPILISHGYYQRRVGCMASGNRSVYIDTDGDLQGCPFCQRKEGSMLGEDYLQTIDRMAKTGCGPYESAPF